MHSIRRATFLSHAAILLLCISSGVAWGASGAGSEVPLNPSLKASRWPAFWMASPSSPAMAPGAFYFRRELSFASVPSHFWVHVSADNRFLLHVNGRYVSEGPARGDLLHWRFETVDLFHTVTITPHLQGLRDLVATIPDPRGAVHARYHLEGTRWTAEVPLPAGTTGILSWKGSKWPLHAGLQVLKLLWYLLIHWMNCWLSHRWRALHGTYLGILFVKACASRSN